MIVTAALGSRPIARELGWATRTPRFPASLGLQLHSHNDYTRPRPIQDALDRGIRSLEVDVWHRGDDLWVSHTGFSFQGTLESLYLRPLALRRDKKPITLWIDFKNGGESTARLLQQKLLAYRGVIDSGRLRVVLTGDATVKRAYARTQEPRLATIDSLAYDLSETYDVKKQAWLSINWASHFDWDGKDKPSLGDTARLAQLLSSAHAKGMRIRLWSTPDTDEFLNWVSGFPVDLVATDRLDCCPESSPTPMRR